MSSCIRILSKVQLTIWRRLKATSMPKVFNGRISDIFFCCYPFIFDKRKASSLNFKIGVQWNHRQCASRKGTTVYSLLTLGYRVSRFWNLSMGGWWVVCQAPSSLRGPSVQTKIAIRSLHQALGQLPSLVLRCPSQPRVPDFVCFQGFWVADHDQAPPSPCDAHV